MPFTVDGQWVTPTERDLQSFLGTLNSDADNGVLKPTPELIEALKSAATIEQEKSGNAAPVDFFRTLSRLRGPVDIVVPVYGGLHVLKDCVGSIQARTHWDYRLIFVDDCSPDPEVPRYLRLIQEEDPDRIFVFTNKRNRGFAATVNRGMSEMPMSPYICVLNSDVVVTDGWLTRMLVALESDPKNCIVNPVTNNTALINVDMYPGRSYLDMDMALSRQSAIKYPEIMPTGFCFMFRKSLIDEIGPFDEAYGSYGEETDYWFRAIKHVTDEGVMLGYKAALADNAYIFHERGTSFSQLGASDHLRQRRAGSERFHKMHPDFGEWEKGFDKNAAVAGLRSSVPPRAFTREYLGNVAWLVKSTGPCGGMYYIADVANHLIERGYNVKICMIPDHFKDKEGKEIQHSLIGNLRTRPIVFEDARMFATQFSQRVFDGPGILFSAVTELTPAAIAAGKLNKRLSVINHVQSWDVDLAEEVGREEIIDKIKEQYTAVPNLPVAKWISEEIRKLGGSTIGVVSPGVNTDIFHERDRDERGDERTTFAILLLKDNPFKGYERGIELAKGLIEHGGANTRVFGIGSDAYPEVPGIVALGGLSQAKMGDVLGREVDVFIDPSTQHSYGLPGLEALYSGAKFVCWENKGVHEYSNHFTNKEIKVLPNDATTKDAVNAVFMINNRDSRVQTVIEEHTRQFSLDAFEEILSGGQEAEIVGNKIEVVSPHMRKHGGPTTLITTANILASLGHEVGLSMVHTDWNPEVVAAAFVPIRAKGWDEVPSGTELVLINSDNPYAKKIMESNPGPKYVMYKLSHNERFKEIEAGNLNLPWDHIVTSTAWLREACLSLEEGWDHNLWAPEDVTAVGWYHYGHPVFACDPETRTYGTAKTGFRMGTLIHAHPLKGTASALSVMKAFKKKYEANFHASAVGEVRANLEWYIQYFRSLNRKDLAHVFKQFDIWLGASHTEGLGRMTLEAMSAGCAVVTTDTGAEFLRDGENCLLYEPGDAQKAGELCDMVANEPDLMQSLVINGYKTACERANPEPFRLKFDEVIKGVLDE